MIVNLGISQGQLSRLYTFPSPDKRFFSHVCLFEDGTYYMEFSESSSPAMSYVLSCGNYDLKGNQIVFSDIVHGFQMEMFLNTFQKSFAWFVGKRSIYYGENFESATPFPSPIPNIKEEREKYKLQHKWLFPFECGVYRDEYYPTGYSIEEIKYGLIRDKYSFHTFDLYIKEDKTYQLFLKGVLLSRGTWTQHENELLLLDADLNHPFYALIGDGVLTSCLFPGDYRNCVLKLSKKCNSLDERKEIRMNKL